VKAEMRFLVKEGLPGSAEISHSAMIESVDIRERERALLLLIVLLQRERERALHDSWPCYVPSLCVSAGQY
jgi:hypothetical protein